MDQKMRRRRGHIYMLYMLYPLVRRTAAYEASLSRLGLPFSLSFLFPSFAFILLAPSEMFAPFSTKQQPVLGRHFHSDDDGDDDVYVSEDLLQAFIIAWERETREIETKRGKEKKRKEKKRKEKKRTVDWIVACNVCLCVWNAVHCCQRFCSSIVSIVHSLLKRMEEITNYKEPYKTETITKKRNNEQQQLNIHTKNGIKPNQAKKKKKTTYYNNKKPNKVRLKEVLQGFLVILSWCWISFVVLDSHRGRYTHSYSHDTMGKKDKKGKKGGKANKAEELRMAQLQARENEAEELQKHENDRREREIQDERISLLREEQLRQIREKEKRIEELSAKVNRVSSTLKDDRMSYASQIESLSVLRDSLMNEVSLLKAENDERHCIFTRERQNYIVQVEQLRQDMGTMKEAFENEKAQLRQQMHETVLELEEVRQEKDVLQENKDETDRASELKIRGLERELERALTLNAALQQALLNAQLDESKRHFEEQLEDERQHTNRVKEDLLRSETKCSHLQEEIDVIKQEWSDAKHAADVELREYQRQLEQVKFDAEYLNSELEAMRKKTTESVQNAEIARDEAQNDAKNCVVEMEALQKRVEELEALLYRKEREHFDKVTFLNAQISNNRTVIAQFQEKIDAERKAHAAESERRNMDMQQTLSELNHLNTTERENAKLRKENESKLLSDVSVLKTTVFQLQSAMEEKERANDRVILAKEEEVKRLREILDAHFIPHRQDVAAQQEVAATDVTFVLTSKNEELQKELAIREQAALETEAWLKARLTNQGQIIETLQNDLKKSELKRLEEINCLENEISRLKKTLEINFIPVPITFDFDFLLQPTISTYLQIHNKRKRRKRKERKKKKQHTRVKSTTNMDDSLRRRRERERESAWGPFHELSPLFFSIFPLGLFPWLLCIMNHEGLGGMRVPNTVWHVRTPFFNTGLLESRSRTALRISLNRETYTEAKPTCIKEEDSEGEIRRDAAIETFR
eukprot:gene8822-6206_t